MNANYPGNHALEIPYPQLYITGDPIVKLYMEKTDGHTRPFVLFVQANNHLNPVMYPRETFAIIHDHLQRFEIDFLDVEIYLTDMEKSTPSIQLWTFTHYKDLYVSDIRFSYPYDELPGKVKAVYANFLGE